MPDASGNSSLHTDFVLFFHRFALFFTLFHYFTLFTLLLPTQPEELEAYLLSLSWAFDWKRLSIGISQSEKIENANRPNPFAPRHEPAQQEVPDRAAQYIQVVKRGKEGIGGTERKEGAKDQVAQHMQVVKKEREKIEIGLVERCVFQLMRGICVEKNWSIL